MEQNEITRKNASFILGPRADVLKIVHRACPQIVSSRRQGDPNRAVFLLEGNFMVAMRYYSSAKRRMEYLLLSLDLDAPDRLTLAQYLLLVQETVARFQNPQSAAHFNGLLLDALRRTGLIGRFPHDPSAIHLHPN